MVSSEKHSLGRLGRWWRGLPRVPDFALDPSERDALQRAAKSDLAKLYFSRRGRVAHKWVHYLDIYDRHFSPFRDKNVKLLEIGVFQGGSLELWREYFGPRAAIFGIDKNPECAHRVDAPNQVRIGSQADPAFLRSVAAELGGPDIVIDDGSHIGRHQRASFFTLFPLLSEGGLYVIEDIHTSYWPRRYKGGLGRRGTAIHLIWQLMDDMHFWYHLRPKWPSLASQIGGLHIYDSIVIIEKKTALPPRHIMVQ
jgi:methyltransferase family protein